MQIKVKNREALLSHGDAEGRKIVLDITEKTLQQLDAYERIKRITHMEGDELCIGSRRWDLSKKRNVYLLGAGKACNHMAMAIDEILGDYLTRGIAIVKISEPTDVFHKTEVYVGGHPLPNAEGLRACKEIIRLIDGATADDLFIVVISGGSSALMSCPIEGISLQDEIDTTDIMLKSGAGIYEINAIRRHISAMNGGMLAKRIRDRGAELIGFGISDAVGTPATGDIGEPYKNYKGTPMGPDQTTLEEARQVIRDYGVADRLPKSVVDYLMHVGPEGETPKAFPENTYFLLNSLPDSCLTAKRISEEMGIPAVILTSYLEGEAREVGSVFASLAREIQNYGNPVKPPCVLLCSGEATTQILDNSTITGHGGPGQELTLSYAISGKKAPGCVCLSIASMDEEDIMIGADKLIADGIVRANDYVLDAEPTNGAIKVAHKGKTWFRLDAKGVACHASTPEKGSDAVAALSEVICAINRRLRALPVHPELGPCAATFGIINGGLNLNIVPGECYCTIDMRLTPPTTNEQSIRLVEEAIAEGCANVPGTSCTYTVLAQRPAVEKDNDSYLLKMLRAATKDVTGEEAPVDFFPGYTDTAVIAATTGNRNCMSYGPGDLFYAHKPDEFVELDDITRCTRVMTRLAESILIDA